MWTATTPRTQRDLAASGLGDDPTHHQAVTDTPALLNRTLSATTTGRSLHLHTSRPLLDNQSLVGVMTFLVFPGELMQASLVCNQWNKMAQSPLLCMSLPPVMICAWRHVSL